MTAPHLPLVLVVWNDAWVDGEATAGHAEATLKHKPMVITTMGWLLVDNDVGVQIANEYYEDGYRGRTFIPRAMVQSMTPFILAKPRKARVVRHLGGEPA